MCAITEGYEVDGEYVGTESLMMKDDNCQKKLEEMTNESEPDEYVFMSTKPKFQPGSWQTVCVFANSRETSPSIKRILNANLTLYHTDCFEKLRLDVDQTVILALIISSAVILICLATFITLFCLKRRGIICINKNQKNQEIIVHQNELYGNLSNQDYFAERYDTNIVDRNQYYEEEYEA